LPPVVKNGRPHRLFAIFGKSLQDFAVASELGDVEVESLPTAVVAGRVTAVPGGHPAQTSQWSFRRDFAS
jgi:hypothetical protein